MRLSTYIQRTRALGDAKIPSLVIDQLAERIAKGSDLTALLKKRSPTLTPRILLGVWRAQRRYAAHMVHLDDVAALRREAGQDAIVPALLKQTLAPHEVAVLQRATVMAPSGRAAEHRRRDAIKEAVALFSACVALTRRDGLVIVSTPGFEAASPLSDVSEAQVESAKAPKAAASDADAPEGDASESAASDVPGSGDPHPLAGTSTMGEVKGDAWRHLRRLESAGEITLHIEPPMERFLEKLNSRGAELSSLTSGFSAEEFLDTLVMPDVAFWAAALNDEEAVLLATRDACNVWFDLLTAERPAQVQYASVWIPRTGKIGVAIINREGRVLGTGEGEGDIVAAVETIVGGHPIEALVVTCEDPEDERFAALEEGFSSFECLVGDALALEAGVEPMLEDAEGPALLALVAGRRRVRPLKYWGQTDPVEIPLVLEQDEVTNLEDALADMRILAFAGVKPDDLARKTSSKAGRRAAAPPLNPLIKSVEDLRPGLEVNGLITNITQFGAFVNIGLSHEGLVHVSELADHFVNDPKEVVQVNQAVKARVLGVDRARRRISLSLRPDRSAPSARPAEGGERVAGTPGDKVRLDDIPGTRGERRRGIGSERGRAATGANRAQALRDLENLFKKK